MIHRVIVHAPSILSAPAKLNLGLEVLGKRPDGYHQIVTILQTIDLCDELEFQPAPQLAYESPFGTQDDLVARALHALAEEGVTVEARIVLRKRIPVAAGLGGGSSDAGTLLGLLAQAGLPRPLVDRIAQRLGSDVPFFLDGGTALARGRGTDLEPLPPPDGWFVIVVPEVRLAHKTPRLYAALTPDDFSDGTATLRQAERLKRRSGIDPRLVRNAFLRPLLGFGEVRRTLDAMAAAGARWAWPSGAGPAIFTWMCDEEQAEEVARGLAEHGFRTLVSAPLRPNWEHAARGIEVVTVL